MPQADLLIHPKEAIKDISDKAIQGVKVCFVNMPIRENAKPNCAPYGVCLLAAILQQYDAEPTILDLNAYRKNGHFLSKSEMEGKIVRHMIRYGEPDVVALSGMITTLAWQEWTAKIIRKILPDAFLVSGNGLATQFKGLLFEWIPELDAVGIGEGDCSILKITHDARVIKMMGARAAEAVGYLKPYHVGEFEGRQRFIYQGGRVSGLDDLPFPAYDLLSEDADDLFPIEEYVSNPIWGGEAANSSFAPFSMRRSLNTISSRGCPYSCKFCFHESTGGRSYSFRSPKSMVEEIAFLKFNHGLDFIAFLDDNFMANRDRITELSSLMDNHLDWDIKWGTHGRLDLANPTTLFHMAKAGCIYIGYGGESASPKILEAMGKGGMTLSKGTEKIDGDEFPKAYTDGVRNTVDAGIHGNLTWMMGYPGETLEDLKRTVAFIGWQERIIGNVNKDMFVATAYPGTAMYDDSKVQGVLRETFHVHEKDGLRDYVLALGDATELLEKNERLVNFSQMTDDQFIRAKTYVERGEIGKIMGMSC